MNLATPEMDPSRTAAGSDRRNSSRFPIERNVFYRVMSKRNQNETGTGVTKNISSSGILFTTQQMLLPGKRVEIAVSWPAQLDDRCQLKLIARGKVIRSEPGMAAVEIQQYEFRTMGAHGLTL